MTKTAINFDRPVPWLDVPYIRNLVERHGEKENEGAVQKILTDVSTELKEVKAHAGKVLKGIGLEEIAKLSAIKSPDLVKQLHATAKEIKEHIYGNRIVTFAPLYFSNLCKNECDYCPFRASNREITRRVLTQEQIADQTEILIKQGHKRILMVAGEAYPETDGFRYVLDTMRTIYSVKVGNEGVGEIRRVNANLAPLSVKDFVKLKGAGIGTYQCFQETYDPKAYIEHHKSGPKANYVRRTNVFDRALKAGIGDFGMGVLFGLADWKFEVLALKRHISHLESLGSGAHTISVPRIEPATGTPVSLSPPNAVSDKDFLKIISIMRLAVPYTGMIMSTRESPEIRRKTLECGISQVSAGSRTDPGGYSEGEEAATSGQFQVGDHRPLDAIVRELLKHKPPYIPSWCTACEKLGREGSDFIPWAMTGMTKYHCGPNALITLKEYLLDYASPETKKIGMAVIQGELDKMEKPRRSNTEALLAGVEAGRRGLCV